MSELSKQALERGRLLARIGRCTLVRQSYVTQLDDVEDQAARCRRAIQKLEERIAADTVQLAMLGQPEATAVMQVVHDGYNRNLS